jgi:pyrroline-5-carboxylate reductase
MQMKPNVLIIGHGRMGQIFSAAWQNHANIWVHDPFSVPHEFQSITSLKEVPTLPTPLIVLVAVKPADVAAVLRKIVTPDYGQLTVISIAAGIALNTLRANAQITAKVVRAMPNTAIRVGQGVVALYAEAVLSSEERNTVNALCGALGRIFWIDDEHSLDLITALSGSGAAYFFRFGEAFARAATELGLHAELASELTRAVLVGAGSLATENGVSLENLRQEITSPGGTTAAGLAVLIERNIDEIAESVLGAAELKARELGLSARTPN